MELSDLYSKIKKLEDNYPIKGDCLNIDQKTTLNSTLKLLEDDLLYNRITLSIKLKLNKKKIYKKDIDLISYNIKKDIDLISYSILNIEHIRIKLGINSSLDQSGQNR